MSDEFEIRANSVGSEEKTTGIDDEESIFEIDAFKKYLHEEGYNSNPYYAFKKWLQKAGYVISYLLLKSPLAEWLAGLLGRPMFMGLTTEH